MDIILLKNVHCHQDCMTWQEEGFSSLLKNFMCYHKWVKKNWCLVRVWYSTQKWLKHYPLQFDKIIVVCTYPLARPANVLLFKDAPSGDVWFLLMYFHPSIIPQSSCNKILKISSCKSLGEFTWTFLRKPCLQ
jgi:hypothetical protein